MEYEELDNLGTTLWNNQCSKLVYDEGYIKLGKVKGVFPRSFLTFSKRISEFEIFDDDVWVLSFPKCGTTWTQEMVWCILNDLDFDKAKEIPLQARFPYLEIRANWSPKLKEKLDVIIYGKSIEDSKKETTMFNNESNEVGTDIGENKEGFFRDSFDIAEDLPRPRCIKSHLHYSLLPKEFKTKSPRMIYVVRNPKDAVSSFYHHSCLLDGYSGSFSDFFNAFITDNVSCSPFWPHVKEFWEIRNKPNVLFLKYEDLKNDLKSVILKTAKFLGKSLKSEKVESLNHHLSFEQMKGNPSVNYEGVVENLRLIHGRKHHTSFMRNGIAGGWKNELSDEQIERMDHWIAKEGIQELY